MLTLTLKLEGLTEKAEKYIEKELKYWEEITKKPQDFKGKKTPREYHISEALFRYFEYMEDARDIEEYIEEKKVGKVKYYTSEEIERQIDNHLATNPAVNGYPLKEGEILIAKVGERKPKQDDDVYMGHHPLPTSNRQTITERPQARDHKRKVVGHRGKRKIGR
ncbi:11209_t:CDS:2 [Ambispora gerdemannii]|uniref:11209_t:CDS:1 n=1 Tax=Ambispora gerdemannii TaxID=144530 RepID=A0A9N8W6M4_9GLOM|nr:11209_t:CDS:2 [Ambispora gerdemannii]